MQQLDGLPRENDAQTDRKFVESLARGFDVLRAFEPGDGFLGNSELSKRTGLPKSTVSRLTYTLTKLGYLSYSERLEKYQLASGVLALGYAFVSNLAIRQIAKPLMLDLANKTNTTVGISDRDRLEMICIEACTAKGVTTFRADSGDKFPLATSASGRAYLAALPDGERELFTGYLQAKHPDDWPQIDAGIQEAVESYKTWGYCYSMGDWDRDVNGISVPLIAMQNCVYTFHAGGPAYRLSEDFLHQDVAPLLKNMVRNIEATLIRY